MTPEAQKIAFAEVLGWTEVRRHTERGGILADDQLFGIPPVFVIGQMPERIPDPFDLNVMHDVELSLIEKGRLGGQIDWDYYNALADVVTDGRRSRAEELSLTSGLESFSSAKSHQRLKAFLIVHGKWVE